MSECGADGGVTRWTQGGCGRAKVCHSSVKVRFVFNGVLVVVLALRL